jgi:hypothetical protein
MLVWRSTDSIARFNDLCAIVKDRLSEGAKEAEDAVLLALRRMLTRRVYETHRKSDDIVLCLW